MSKNTDKGEEVRFERNPKGLIAEFFAPIAGCGVTIPSFSHKIITEQYPHEQARVQPRFRDRHQLNRCADDLEKCIGCELRVWACPADMIFAKAGANTPEGQYSLEERFGKVYQINYLRCIFCGLCMEACPTRTFTMSNELELAAYDRVADIYERQDLLVSLKKGMLAASHPMAEGLCDGDYYRGEVTGPTQTQVDWVKEYRPDDPTIASAEVAAEEARW